MGASEGAVREAPPAALPAAALRRRVARGSAWVFAGKMLASSMGIGVNALLARLLPSGELGVYFLIFTSAMFGAELAALGMDRAVVRLVASSLGIGKPERARHAVVVAFQLGAAGSLVAAAVLLLGLGQFLADHVFHSAALGGVVVGFAGWLVALTFQTLVAESFRGFQRFGLATLSDGLVANVFMIAVFALLLLVNTHLTLGRALLITVATTSLSLLVTGGLLLRRLARLPAGGGVSYEEALAVGWPLLITNAAAFLVSWGVDLWIVGAFEATRDVAIYGAAAKLVFFVAVPNLIVLQVVPPMVAELHAQGRMRDLEYVLRSVATLASAPAAVLLLVFGLGGSTIMGLVYGDFYRRGAAVLAILCAGRLLAVAAGPCQNALMMTGQQRALMNLTLASGVASIAGGIAAVHLFGIVGVACTTSAVQVFQNVAALVITRRRVGVWTHARLSMQPLREAATTFREALGARGRRP